MNQEVAGAKKESKAGDGGVGVQEISTVVPTHQWVKLGPGTSANPLVGRTRSWGLWLQGRGVPKLMSGHW